MKTTVTLCETEFDRDKHNIFKSFIHFITT